VMRWAWVRVSQITVALGEAHLKFGKSEVSGELFMAVRRQFNRRRRPQKKEKPCPDR